MAGRKAGGVLPKPLLRPWDYSTGTTSSSTTELRVQPSEADKEPPSALLPLGFCPWIIQQAGSHLRGEFPGPEEAPGPQLLELHGPAQVAFDLGQLQVGLGVQPLRVGQQLVIDYLLLRDEGSGTPAWLRGIPAVRPLGRLHEPWDTPPPPPTLTLPGPHPSPGSASSASLSPCGRRRPVVLGSTAGPPSLGRRAARPARSPVRWRRQRPLRLPLPPRTGSAGDAAAAAPGGSGRASSHFRGGAGRGDGVGGGVGGRAGTPGPRLPRRGPGSEPPPSSLTGRTLGCRKLEAEFQAIVLPCLGLHAPCVSLRALSRRWPSARQ